MVEITNLVIFSLLMFGLSENQAAQEHFLSCYQRESIIEESESLLNEDKETSALIVELFCSSMFEWAHVITSFVLAVSCMFYLN